MFHQSDGTRRERDATISYSSLHKALDSQRGRDGLGLYRDVTQATTTYTTF